MRSTLGWAAFVVLFLPRLLVRGPRWLGARMHPVVDLLLRPFAAAEREAWPVLLRGAALRFWLSRLHDLHLPRPGELVHAHDPAHFRDILERRIAEAPPWLEAP